MSFLLIVAGFILGLFYFNLCIMLKPYVTTIISVDEKSKSFTFKQRKWLKSTITVYLKDSTSFSTSIYKKGRKIKYLKYVNENGENNIIMIHDMFVPYKKIVIEEK